MWTLAEARARLSDRLSEDSTVFWSGEARNDYLNDAQRFIASLTRGIVFDVTGVVGVNNPFLPLPANVFNASPAQGYTATGRVLTTVPIHQANLWDLHWRRHRSKTPMWVVTDFARRRAYVSPVPVPNMEIQVAVAVHADTLVNDTQLVFNGSGPMEKYQTVLLNIAAAYALLKERYDQDAERYYQFAMQELSALGVSPEEIPTFSVVRDERREDS